LSEPRFQLSFLSPRYWGYGALAELILVASLLPRSVSGRIGDQLGDLFRQANSKRRRIAAINIRLCFPEYDEEMRERMLVEHFRAYGRGIIDLGLIWRASEHRLERLFTVRGLDSWLDQASANSRTLLITPHTTAMDLGGIYLSRFYPLVSMMKRTHNPMLTWLLCQGRRRFGAEIIMRDEGIRTLVRSLTQGRSGYLMPDEDLPLARTVFAPFFGIETATLSVVGRLSNLTGAKVFPTFTRRLDTGQYEVEIQPYLEDFPSGDDIKDACRINAVFESSLRAAPEQYLWTMQRFKNRPDGEPSPYT
jgi:lauroyl/myristoyl acyltransferase